MDTYRATNTLNGKFYIGSSVDFKRRKSQHLCCKADYPFYRDLRKNPEAFVWEVYTDDLDTNEHEVKLLKEFFFDAKCYNINPSAERPPDSTGKKRWKNELTQVQKLCVERPEGEGWERGVLQTTKNKHSGKNNSHYGIPRTAAVKQAISRKNSGEKSAMYGVTGALHSCSKAIIAIKPDGTEEHFGGVHEAAKKLKTTQSGLSHQLKSGKPRKRGNLKGWRFIFAATPNTNNYPD